VHGVSDLDPGRGRATSGGRETKRPGECSGAGDTTVSSSGGNFESLVAVPPDAGEEDDQAVTTISTLSCTVRASDTIPDESDARTSSLNWFGEGNLKGYRGGDPGGPRAGSRLPRL
jgi:hypothetical protein